VKKSSKESATLLAGIWGLEPSIVEQVNSHRSYEVRPVKLLSLAELLKIADTFLNEKVLPKRLNTQALAIFKP
jgi:sulfonate transport system substrate-binding protein